jgi:glycosyltransferase involved in cell wall biosynthesis
VFEADCRGLSSAGHAVFRLERDNRALDESGFLQRVSLGASTVWSGSSYREIQDAIKQHDIQVVHFHNTFPQISPSAYYACTRAAVPVVQTLHNYRLLCPGATFYRDGSVCEACQEKSLLSAVRHACYRQSRAATTATVAMLAVHRQLGTWQRQVTLYIALTEFARRKHVSAGLPPERITVRPNALDRDPGARVHHGGSDAGSFILFAGRLTEEKGVRVLLDAYEKFGLRVPLRIAGDGPLADEVRRRAGALGGLVEVRGLLSRDQVIDELKAARFLVFPSQWYEGLPMTILEAFACGVPVVASAIGGIPEMVEAGRTGWLVAAGDARLLAAEINAAWNSEAEIARRGAEARREFETTYDPGRAAMQLTAIYRRAMATDLTQIRR